MVQAQICQSIRDMTSKVPKGRETITSYNIRRCVKDHETGSAESARLPHQGGWLSSLLLPRELFDQ
jgi:hypothetical protein